MLVYNFKAHLIKKFLLKLKSHKTALRDGIVLSFGGRNSFYILLILCWLQNGIFNIVFPLKLLQSK